MKKISHIWSHKRTRPSFLFLISLPKTEEFNKEEPLVKDSIEQLRNLGAVVCDIIDHKSMSQIVDYKYVIVIAHYDRSLDSLMLSTGSMTTDEFVSLIPENFVGVFDFSSCYSAGAMMKIKARTGNRCKVQTVVKQTTLALRMIMYPQIVRLINCDDNIDYDDAYCRILDTVLLSMTAVDCKKRDNSEPDKLSIIPQRATKLGKGEEECYSIYAPTQVKRNKTFVVSLFFHKKHESNSVELIAQRFDPKTSKVETEILPIQLDVKDKVTAHISINNGCSDCVNINNGIDTKSIFWYERTAKIQFSITVNDDYINDSLLCEMQIEVNSNPVCECMFEICVSDIESQVPCSIALQPHNYNSERNRAKEHLCKQLNNNLKRLEEEIKSAVVDDVRRMLTAQIDVCNKCIRQIDQANIRDTQDSIKKIFISSTSDMSQYRDIVKNEVVSCGMFPIDYRSWYQSDQPPCDVCCRKVMESDAVMFIIGSKYGYIEPSVGISMTQLEYETALMSGIKILAYIIDPLNESDEDEQRQNKQKDFINEIKSSRIMKFFADNYSLEKEAIRELSYLK